MSRYEQAKAQSQKWLLSQHCKIQEDRIAAHYVAFAHLAMQLKQLCDERVATGTCQLDETIEFLTGKIREGHLMEFGIALEWPKEDATQ
jgi:hypothetical protein